MKQSYDKAQHEIAKRKKLPLICIGYNGRYMKKPQPEAMFWGPANEAMLKDIQALFLKICKSRN